MTARNASDGPGGDQKPAPCLWCKATMLPYSVNASEHYLRCSNAFKCDAQGPTRGTPAEAVTEWNRIARDEWQPIPADVAPGTEPWDGREYVVFGVNPDGEDWQALGHWWSQDNEWHQEAIGEESPDTSLYTPTHYHRLLPPPKGTTP